MSDRSDLSDKSDEILHKVRKTDQTVLQICKRSTPQKGLPGDSLRQLEFYRTTSA